MHATKTFMKLLKPPINFNSVKDTMLLLHVIEPYDSRKTKV